MPGKRTIEDEDSGSEIEGETEDEDEDSSDGENESATDDNSECDPMQVEPVFGNHCGTCHQRKKKPPVPKNRLSQRERLKYDHSRQCSGACDSFEKCHYLPGHPEAKRKQQEDRKKEKQQNKQQQQKEKESNIDTKKINKEKKEQARKNKQKKQKLVAVAAENWKKMKSQLNLKDIESSPQVLGQLIDVFHQSVGDDLDGIAKHPSLVGQFVSGLEQRLVPANSAIATNPIANNTITNNTSTNNNTPISSDVQPPRSLSLSQQITQHEQTIVALEKSLTQQQLELSILKQKKIRRDQQLSPLHLDQLPLEDIENYISYLQAKKTQKCQAASASLPIPASHNTTIILQ